MGILLLYLSFRGIRLGDFWSDIKNARYTWVFAGMVIMLAAHVARAYRWNLQIEPMGYKPRLFYTTMAVLIGYFANLAFPRIGEVTKCGSLSKSDKIPMESLVGTVIVERVFDLLTVIILLAVVFFARIHVFGAFISKNLFGPFLNSIQASHDHSLLLWIIILAVVLGLVVTAFLFRQRLKKYKGYGKLGKIWAGLKNGLQSLFVMKKMYRFLFFTFLIWLLYLISTYILFFSLPATSALNFLDALFILVFSSIGMTLPTQGGFGTYHLLVSLGLTLYGISREDGMAYAILSHESQTLMIIILGMISFLIVFGSKRKSSMVEHPNR